MSDELTFIKKVLNLFDGGDNADNDVLSWVIDDNDNLHFTIWMNDFFGYALSYCVYVEKDDLSLLEQSIKDCKSVMEYGSVYAHYLFVCRKEQLRPIPPYYNDDRYKLPSEILKLIDESVPKEEER